MMNQVRTSNLSLKEVRGKRLKMLGAGEAPCVEVEMLCNLHQDDD